MMQVKFFDFEHEIDLEKAVNAFLLQDNIKVIDIKYQVSHFYALNEQLYSFSVMIIFENI